MLKVGKLIDGLVGDKRRCRASVCFLIVLGMSGSQGFQYQARATPPVLLSQPQSQAVLKGAGVNFSVDFTAPGLTTNTWMIDPQSGPEAATNSFPIGNATAFVSVRYDFYSFPDRMRVYRGNSNIWDTGLVMGPGSFALTLPPGETTNLAIVMNEEGGFAGTLWIYAVDEISGPLSFQWLKDGAPIAGATSPSYSIANADLSDAGRYTVALQGADGLTLSDAAVLQVFQARLLGNGVPLGIESYYTGAVQVAVETSFSDAAIYYTLNGMKPDTNSFHYSGAFTLSRSAVIRAVAFDAASAQAVEVGPAVIHIVPGYQLEVYAEGGGYIMKTPMQERYISNTVVTIAAVPQPGWQFLQWEGDAQGTNPTTTVVMTRPKCVEAVFGTPFSAGWAGSGSVRIDPVLPLYPAYSRVRLTAVPQPGSAFANWSDGWMSYTRTISVYYPTNSITATFTSLPPNRSALTVIPTGFGNLSTPFTINNHVVTNGTPVYLWALPDYGQDFLGWSGDVSSTQNPLQVTLTSSKVVTANFTKRPRLGPVLCGGVPNGEEFQLWLTGESGTRYVIEATTNFGVLPAVTAWTPLTTVTNTLGEVRFSVPLAPNQKEQFYRAVEAP